MAIGAIIGAGIGAAGAIIAAEDEAEMLEYDAELKRMQADEIMKRAERNKEAAKKRGQKLIAEQSAAFAKGGVDVSSKTSITVMEDTAASIIDELEDISIVAGFEAMQIRTGADIADLAAENTRTAGLIQAAGSLFGGATDYYKLSSRQTVTPKSKPKSKPK
jgi:hypothetical protein